MSRERIPAGRGGALRCPECGARPDNPCVDERGALIRVMHAKRLQAAQRARGRR